MHVVDSRIRLSLIQKPGHFGARAEGEKVIMFASPLQVRAQCQVDAGSSYTIPVSPLVCSANPRFAPWKLGFMQVQVLENSWVYHRGAQRDDGCVLLDLSARRELKICRDYEPSLGTVWYECSKNIYDCYGLPDVYQCPPWNVEFNFGDNPLQEVGDHVLNEQTQRRNYLHEARCAMAFVTTLTEQLSEGVFKHHRHFFWSAIWHIQAVSPEAEKNKKAFKVLPGGGFWMSAVKRGGPMDPRYLKVLNNSQLTPSLNQIVTEAPVAKSTASDWQRFPLMDQKDSKF